jgi:hypothetical protein
LGWECRLRRDYGYRPKDAAAVAQEIAERFELIDAFLESGNPDDATRSSLANVRDKLKRREDELPKPQRRQTS